MRVSPCDEPLACGGTNRSMPRTRFPRFASWQTVALPIAPKPSTTVWNLIIAPAPLV
jgi:hypothetical protein